MSHCWQTIKEDFAGACTCWTDAALSATAEEVKMCKASNDSKKITTQLKACTKTFGKCRKYEDAAITSIMSCKDNKNKLTEKVFLRLIQQRRHIYCHYSGLCSPEE